MISAQRLPFVFIIGLLLAASVASAQTSLLVQPGNEWRHGTTLNVFGGGALTPGDGAAAAGGAFGWELTPRFALEGSGTWFDWGRGAHAFSATMTAQAAILTPQPFVPFLAAGMGVYHASFDRFDTMMPRFYRERMARRPPQMGRVMPFTDPALLAGGGVNVFLNRHWTIRPEVMANVVLRDSRSVVVTTGVVRLAYHFEDHPITP